MSVHGLPVKLPPLPGPVALQETLPAGVDAPAPELSATVAEHVTVDPPVVVFGLHDTLVLVVRFTLSVTELLLVPWTESLAL